MGCTWATPPAPLFQWSLQPQEQKAPPQLRRAEAKGAAPTADPAQLPCGASAPALAGGVPQGQGWDPGGTRETQAPAHLCPTRGAGRADQLQNSLALRGWAPRWGVPLPCLQRLGPRLGPGGVRQRPPHTRAGAGCCCLGEGASLTSSRAAISHAVRTLNLKGPCVPASEQAGFCF